MQATAIDPKFALAYAHASILNSWFFPERKAKARAQAEEALRLSPKLGKGHVALGLCLYVGEKKYDAALKEFEIAAATSPNDAYIYNYVGGIYRRQGRWRDALVSFDRAISLDPLNSEINKFAANNHLYLRDWAAAAAGYTHTLEIEPESIVSRMLWLTWRYSAMAIPLRVRNFCRIFRPAMILIIMRLGLAGTLPC